MASLLPETLDLNFLASFGKLSREQAGHLRHFHNLATQRPGEWALMGSQEPGQEWVDAYRYQLATVAYASGAAHFHHLPALRSAFMTLIGQLIEKMLCREVWGYWFLTSHSGTFVDPDLKKLREPWPDPTKRENIMYSGHLLLMVSLYSILFNDDRYDKEDSLVFDWNPIFWGMGPERFCYDRKSLQKAILSEMELEGWLGVCCEPNSIFLVCNQFPPNTGYIIAFRYNDVRDGTHVVEKVVEKYTAAWKAKGMTQSDGLFVRWYAPNQDRTIPCEDIGSTAWASAFMNAWNPSVAQRTFKDQKIGYLFSMSENRINLNSTAVANTIRRLFQDEGVDPNSQKTLQKARDIVARMPPTPEVIPYATPLFGYVLLWTSEVGDDSSLLGLLNHADEYLNPTWANGGLYYPSNNKRFDPDGNWVQMDTFTGNSAFAYARLNVPNGQRKMWLDAWTPNQLSSLPYLEGLDLASGVDFLRVIWDEKLQAIIITMRSWDGNTRRVRPQVCNLPPGKYGIYIDGILVETRAIEDATSIELDVTVSGQELDLVILAQLPR